MSQYLLGISAYYHDSASALIKDGRVIAAAQEERFSRKKHDSSFPRNSIAFCLSKAGISAEALSHVVFYDKPHLKFDRLFATYMHFAPRGFESFKLSFPSWIKDKLFQRKNIIAELEQLSKEGSRKSDWDSKLLFSEHHLSHIASAFYPSPHTEALILALDGVGEWVTSSAAIGKGADIKIIKEINFPDSLGLLYSAFTYFLGFKVNSGEYKVMGLAPYGDSKFKNLILDKIISVQRDGSFRLNMDYFEFCTGLRMTNEKFEALFGIPRRTPEQALTQIHMDIAASLQAVTEEVMLRLCRSLARETQMQNLCLAGGVALNCVANGAIYNERLFKNIWIQPAAGDAGGALGAALAAYHLYLQQPRRVDPHLKDSMSGSYLGPEFSQEEIESRLNNVGAVFETLEDDAICTRAAQLLDSKKAIGWFQGGMEFGPRALGNRSILADPRDSETQTTLNLKVKFRESFRPFAPAVLEGDTSDYFEFETGESPYMLMVAKVKESIRLNQDSARQRELFGIEKLKIPRSSIPAVTHVDFSARLQTVDKERNPKFYSLLSEFKNRTGCSVLVNTSFNVRGEPIVCTPEDAFNCFMGTNIDALVIGNCLLLKEQQKAESSHSYMNQFELD